MSQVKELAKETRKVLKKAFPNTKFSVTSKYNEIKVAVMESDVDFGVAYNQVNQYRIYEDYTGEQKQILQSVVDFISKDVREVVYDGDYGSVPNYYINISIGKWDKPFKFKND